MAEVWDKFSVEELMAQIFLAEERRAKKFAEFESAQKERDAQDKQVRALAAEHNGLNAEVMLLREKLEARKKDNP